MYYYICLAHWFAAVVDSSAFYRQRLLAAYVMYATLTSAHTHNFNFSFNSNSDLWLFSIRFSIYLFFFVQLLHFSYRMCLCSAHTVLLLVLYGELLIQVQNWRGGSERTNVKNQLIWIVSKMDRITQRVCVIYNRRNLFESFNNKSIHVPRSKFQKMEMNNLKNWIFVRAYMPWRSYDDVIINLGKNPLFNFNNIDTILCQ